MIHFNKVREYRFVFEKNRLTSQGEVFCETSSGEKRLPGGDSPELKDEERHLSGEFEVGNRWKLFTVEHVKLLIGESKLSIVSRQQIS